MTRLIVSGHIGVVDSRSITLSAVVRLSPVNMTMRMPSARGALSAHGGCALDGIGYRDNSRRQVIDSDEHRGRATGAKPVGFRFKSLRAETQAF
ncbi:MAG: hypothetical protein ABI859_07975 [Pseudomonadota bacterium]